jgi:hypothetical protein
MTDKEFLCWIHERLEHKHRESPLADYMHRLRGIIANTREDQVSPWRLGINSLEELKATFVPKGYRRLNDGEMMEEDDLIWSANNQWEARFATTGSPLEPWSPSFRPWSAESTKAMGTTKKNNEWRSKPITDRQLQIMEERHIPSSHTMTRGEASDAITEDLEMSPHPFSEDAFCE